LADDPRLDELAHPRRTLCSGRRADDECGEDDPR
jgi:hypothetical protein